MRNPVNMVERNSGEFLIFLFVVLRIIFDVLLLSLIILIFPQGCLKCKRLNIFVFWLFQVLAF